MLFGCIKIVLPGFFIGALCFLLIILIGIYENSLKEKIKKEKKHSDKTRANSLIRRKKRVRKFKKVVWIFLIAAVFFIFVQFIVLAAELFRNGNIKREKRRYLYSNNNQQKTIDDAFFHDDTSTKDEREEQESVAYLQMIHFDWVEGKTITWGTLNDIIEKLDGLYYMEPVKENVDIQSLSKEEGKEVKRLAEKIRGFQDKKEKGTLNLDDMIEERDAYKKSYGLRNNKEIIFQSGRVNEDLFWKLKKEGADKISECLQAAANSLSDFEEFVRYKDRTVCLPTGECVEYYPENILFREVKTLYGFGTADGCSYAREAIMISYGMSWHVSERETYFSSDQINKERALAYYYRAQCCEKMLQWAEGEIWFDLCVMGIDCCDNALELWKSGGYKEENNSRSNAEKLKKNLESRKKNRKKLSESLDSSAE